MSEEEKTPLEVIVQNAMFVKTEIIKVMMQVSSTVKAFDNDLRQADKALASVEDEDARREIQAVKQGVIERKAKYLSEVVLCQVQLREAATSINDQLSRQVPTEKRAVLIIDMDQLIKDCEEEHI